MLDWQRESVSTDGFEILVVTEPEMYRRSTHMIVVKLEMFQMIYVNLSVVCSGKCRVIWNIK